MSSTKSSGTKRTRHELENKDKLNNDLTKKQKLDGGKSMHTKSGNSKDSAEFKKELNKLLKPDLFICNDTDCGSSWSELIDLPSSQVYQSIKSSLKDGISKIIDNTIDDITSSIISFCYVSDRILCCIEDQNDAFFGNVTDEERWICYDKLYAMIIGGGLDSNIKYSKYNELALEWNKYLKPKEMIKDLFLYGEDSEIWSTSDEERYERIKKQTNSLKRDKLKQAINKIKNLIIEYKKEGILKQNSPYSVKVPSGQCGDDADEPCFDFYTDEDELDDKEVLNGYGENKPDEYWNYPDQCCFYCHYIVFEFKDNRKIAMRADVCITIL